MSARIYQPAKTAMQSGMAKTHAWVLEFASADSRTIDPLMGWTSSDDTQTQVRLRFETLEAAEAYAKDAGLSYVVSRPNQRAHTVRPGGYGDNFASARRANWTH